MHHFTQFVTTKFSSDSFPVFCQVVLPERFRGRGNDKAQQSAIKLVELGPRLTMELFKVEAGMCEGDILYHKFESKSEEDAMKTKQKVDASD